MARGSIRIRYTVRVTRRVRVQTRIRYSVRTLAVARYVVAQARSDGAVVDSDQLAIAAQRMLPPGSDTDEILDAIDAVCHDDEDA